MSRTIYRPPFHRQILPWVFAAVFFAAAPALIFYTSGYRLNTKKSVIERTGTIIVDTTPRGARITIDDKDTGRTTPSTFQEVAPGPHRIRVERDGYHAWEKTLDVRPEQVTFANTTWLWKKSEPTLMQEADIDRVAADEQGQILAVILRETTTTASLATWTPRGGLSTRQPIPDTEEIPNPYLLRWSDGARAILLGGQWESAPAWWMPASGSNRPERLPDGFYYWDGEILIGRDRQARYRLDVRNASFTRETASTSTLDAFGDLSLIRTSDGGLALRESGFERRLLALPYGEWMFAGEREAYTLLNSDFWHWISVRLRFGGPVSQQATGDWPRWLHNADPLALLVNGNELTVWNPENEPDVIWRRSEPIIEAAWHRSGEVVFLANATDVIALDLDARDGRRAQTLATFDRINGLAVIDRMLYVAGVRNGTSGLWRLEIE